MFELIFVCSGLLPEFSRIGRALALGGATTFDGFNIVDITNAKDGLTPVPEPSAYALIGSSLVLGFAALRRKRARRNVA